MGDLSPPFVFGAKDSRDVVEESKSQPLPHRVWTKEEKGKQREGEVEEEDTSEEDMDEDVLELGYQKR